MDCSTTDSRTTARSETRVTDSFGRVAIVQRNARGMPGVAIDTLGGVTSYRYDLQGLLTAT